MQTLTYHRKKIYDPVLRLLHAWNGLAIVFLIFTIWLSDLFDQGAAESALWQLHIYLGYALVLGLVSRLVWGLVGPSHARFADMWHPAAWWRALRQVNFQVPPRFGHHLLASGVYLLVYGLLMLMALTGLGLAAVEHSTGPFNAWFGDMTQLEDLFEEPHEVIYYLIMGFVVVHIAALIWHEKKDQTPIAQAMVTGYQYEVVIDAAKGEDHA